MRALDLRAESTGHPRVEAFVRHFFALLGAADWAGAAQLVTDPVQIFDQVVARQRFALHSDRSFAAEPVQLRQLPPTIPFGVEEQQQLFGGPIGAHARVCFVTAAVDGQPVSYGVVVELADASDPRVSRLFDPTPFKEMAEQLGAR